MPYDFPKPITGNTRDDIRQIWDSLFHIVEQLRLAEEEQARRDGRTDSSASLGMTRGAINDTD